ncbi:MAG: YciI family protein [Caldilineaceae bacterium]
MRYLLMIYGDEQMDASASPQDMEAMMNAYGAFTNEAREAGVLQGGEALQPTSTATTVRVRNGKTNATDGPFAETKEQLGGYYLLDCKNLDEAIAYAAKIPGAKHGSVEVRPIMEFE